MLIWQKILFDDVNSLVQAKLLVLNPVFTVKY